MYLYFNPVDGGAVLHPMYPGGPSPGVSTRGPSLDATFNVYGYLCIFPPPFPLHRSAGLFFYLGPFPFSPLGSGLAAGTHRFRLVMGPITVCWLTSYVHAGGVG